MVWSIGLATTRGARPAWFERTASAATVKTIYSFKTDKVHVIDDF